MARQDGIAQMRAEGRFFAVDVSKTILGNVLDAVEWLAEKGPPLVARELSDLKHPTGFTARNFEGFTYKRQQMFTGREVQSLFGKVRMRPGLSRGPGSEGYPAARVPYIVNSVLESGRWRRQTGSRIAHHHVRRTMYRLRAYARAIRADLTRGLE